MSLAGADQVAHVEITREIARRFNHIYGREPGFEELAESACDKMGKKGAKLIDRCVELIWKMATKRVCNALKLWSKTNRTSHWLIESD